MRAMAIKGFGTGRRNGTKVDYCAYCGAEMVYDGNEERWRVRNGEPGCLHEPEEFFEEE